ncbi:MAG: hypothetical protein IJ598_10920 [Ruminococcus sp.]|nr:hypothetical protein [Ruminococcus sp.]
MAKLLIDSDLQINKSKTISEIEKESRDLFELLLDENLNNEKFVNTLDKFLKKTPRMYYSVYSKMIYSLTDVQVNNLDSNLNALMDFTKSDEFDKLFPEDTSKYGDKKLVIRVIHKLWDHSKLAENQITEIKKDTFWDNFEGEKIKIEESIKKEGRKLNRELITLVGIFTAMAFLVFGGLNSLSGIFEGASEGLPVLKMSIVSLLWGICVYNLIYLFMFLIAKLTDNDISTNKESKSFLRRHIIYFTGNAVMLSALYFAAWLYFVKIDFRGWYSRIYSICHSLSPFVGPALWALAIILFFLAWLLFIIVRAIVLAIKNRIEKCKGEKGENKDTNSNLESQQSETNTAQKQDSNIQNTQNQKSKESDNKNCNTKIQGAKNQKGKKQNKKRKKK